MGPDKRRKIRSLSALFVLAAMSSSVAPQPTDSSVTGTAQSPPQGAAPQQQPAAPPPASGDDTLDAGDATATLHAQELSEQDKNGKPVDWTFDTIAKKLADYAAGTGDLTDGVGYVSIDVARFANPRGMDFCKRITSTDVTNLMKQTLGIDASVGDYFKTLFHSEVDLSIYPTGAVIKACEDARAAAEKESSRQLMVGNNVAADPETGALARMDVPMSLKYLRALECAHYCYIELRAMPTDPSEQTPSCASKNYKPDDVQVFNMPANWNHLNYQRPPDASPAQVPNTGGLHPQSITTLDDLKTYMLQHPPAGANWPAWDPALIDVAKKTIPGFQAWWDTFDKTFYTYKPQANSQGYLQERQGTAWWDHVDHEDVAYVRFPSSNLPMGESTMQMWYAQAIANLQAQQAAQQKTAEQHAKDIQQDAHGKFISTDHSVAGFTNAAVTAMNWCTHLSALAGPSPESTRASVCKGGAQALMETYGGMASFIAGMLASSTPGALGGSASPFAQHMDQVSKGWALELEEMRPIFGTMPPWQQHGEPWDAINNGFQWTANQLTNIGLMTLMSGGVESPTVEAILSYTGKDAAKLAQKELLGTLMKGGMPAMMMGGSAYTDVYNETGDKDKAMAAGWAVAVLTGLWFGGTESASFYATNAEKSAQQMVSTQFVRMAGTEQYENALRVIANSPSMRTVMVNQGIKMGVGQGLTAALSGKNALQVAMATGSGFGFGAGIGGAMRGVTAIPESKAFRWVLETTQNKLQIATKSLQRGTYVSGLEVASVSLHPGAPEAPMYVMRAGADGQPAQVMDPKTGMVYTVDGKSITAKSAGLDNNRYLYVAHTGSGANRVDAIVPVDENGKPIPGALPLAAPLSRYALVKPRQVTAPRVSVAANPLDGSVTGNGAAAPGGNGAGSTDGGATAGGGTGSAGAAQGDGAAPQNQNVAGSSDQAGGNRAPKPAEKTASSDEPQITPEQKAQIEKDPNFQKSWGVIQNWMIVLEKQLKIDEGTRTSVEAGLVMLGAEEGPGALRTLAESLGDKPYDLEWFRKLLSDCGVQVASAGSPFERAFPEFARLERQECELPKPRPVEAIF